MRGLLKFQTWCAPGEAEGRKNFSTKFCLNVRSKTGDGRTKFSREGAKPPPQTPPPLGRGIYQKFSGEGARKNI